MAKRSTASLPPDGGWGWMIVIGTFMVHVILDGIFYSFGILFAEFVDYFHTSTSETSLVISLAMGIPFLIGPFASILTNIFGSRIVMIVGSLVLASGFILTIFTPNLYFMYFSLGILAGFGYGMTFLPAIVMLNQYFEKRRAFVVGIAASGSGIGTFAFSPLIKLLIDTYGWKGTMLILSGIFLNCAVCGAIFRPLTNLRRNKNPTALSGKSSKGSSVIIDPEKLNSDILCNSNAYIPEKRRVLVHHSDEPSDDITVDDLDKVDTISLGNCNTSAQEQHLACPKKKRIPADLSSEPSKAISMEDLEKLDNTSLRNCNMLVARQKGAPADGAKQKVAKKKEINGSFIKCTPNSNHFDDEDIYTSGAAAMSELKTGLRDETRDQSNKDHSNQTDQSLDSSSSKSYVNSMNQDNLHLAVAHQLLKTNQAFNAAEQCENDELEHQAKDSFSQLLDKDKTDTDTTVSPFDESETHSNSHDEPLVLCRCLTLSPKNAKELRSSFQLSLMKDSRFMIFLASYMLYGIGYYVPYVYLPVYAESAGIEADLAAWTISAAGIANTAGRVIFGFVSDFPGVNRLYLYSVSMVICGGASTLLPLCDNFPLLIAYACIFGAFSGVTITLTSVVLVDLVGIDLLSEAFGISYMVAGVTSLAGPPLAGWIFDETKSYTISFIMTGIAIAISGLILFIIPCIQKRRRQREE